MFLCLACGAPTMGSVNHPEQKYCSKSACQRARKNAWQRDKRKVDVDYAENQMRAQQSWAQRNPGYWAAYREAHPEYASGNVARQRIRDGRPVLAKMDAARLASGIYILRGPLVAKGASAPTFVVRIDVLR